MPRTPKPPTIVGIVTPEEEEAIRWKLIRHILRLQCEKKGCSRGWCKRTGRCEEIGKIDRMAGGKRAAGT